MVSKNLHEHIPSAGVTQQIFFAGDGVRLAGQIDYPDTTVDHRGYPLIFVIPHATCTSRSGYQHIARLGTELGFAVFRWDKRGTGQSGSGSGTVEQDTINAYETATTQPGIDKNRVIIAAQNEGSLLLAEAYDHITNLTPLRGVILLGNMLDEKKITTISAPVHIVVSKNDWNAWQIYAEKTAKIHANATGHATTFYVAPNTNRRLMYVNGGTFHKGAGTSIKDWLNTVCPTSTSN